MSGEITAICQDQTCGKQFQYVLKPGFPRKYCVTCSAAKKAAYESKSHPVSNKEDMEKPVEVVKPGVIPDKFMSREEWTHLNCKIMCAKDLVVSGIARDDAVEIIEGFKKAFE